MDPLATVDDLAARLGSMPPATRAGALLTDASAAVRAYTRQNISRETNTVRLTPSYGAVRLPQWPIVAVTAAVNDLGAAVNVTWPTGGSAVMIRTDIPLTVTYRSGYDPVPDDIIAIVCQVAGRALGLTADSSAIQSESLGAYSYSIQAAAAAGPLGLLADERRILNRYRRPAAPISVLQ